MISMTTDTKNLTVVGPHYSLFRPRKPRSPIKINGERGFLIVNRQHIIGRLQSDLSGPITIVVSLQIYSDASEIFINH